jgi:SAM-dependent methyltransferase
VTAENLDSYVEAYGDDFPFADENLGMLNSYVDYFLESIAGRDGIDLLSLGIGYQTVSRRVVSDLGHRLTSYRILEGSQAVMADFLARWPLEFVPDVVQTYFEDFESPQRFDAIEMGFVLEHVDDPALIVRQFKTLLKPDGIIGMAVPNARSLHRLIGHEAGLLDDVFKLSEYDRALGHKRYFDLSSFRQLAETEGLVVRRARGIMLKPVTTAQLAALDLPAQVIRALYGVADSLPAISNALYLETSLP